MQWVTRHPAPFHVPRHPTAVTRRKVLPNLAGGKLFSSKNICIYNKYSWLIFLAGLLKALHLYWKRLKVYWLLCSLFYWTSSTPNNQNTIYIFQYTNCCFLLIPVYFFSSISSSWLSNRVQHKFFNCGGEMESRAKAVFSRKAYRIQCSLLPSWFEEELKLFHCQLHKKYRNP